MSELALRERRRKQDWARPGGFHDRLLATLKIALPTLIGLLMAYLAMAPLTRSQEISFILDKNKVEVAKERMRVQAAQYRGQDDQGRAFTVSALSAVQPTSRDPLVDIGGVNADIQLVDGPARLAAERGRYNLDTQEMAVVGPILVTGPDNYRLATRDVTIDLNRRLMQSRGGVEGRMPLGSFTADNLQADLGERTVTLTGRARLHIVQGGLR